MHRAPWHALRSLKAGAVLTVLALVGGSGCDPKEEKPEGPPVVELGTGEFDGARAFGELEELVRLGNRFYGAPERQRALAALEEKLRPLTSEVKRQTFQATERNSRTAYELSNIIGRIRPQATRRILLGTHFDTRLWAEKDPDEARRDQPIPGANDGTSGVVVILEALRAVHDTPALAQLGIDVVLFDAEEFGRPGNRDYSKGAEHFASRLRELYPKQKPEAAIILDMVGERDVVIEREANSDREALWLNEFIWEVGKKHAPEVFVRRKQGAIHDDHVALQRAGIPSALLIDLDYPEWHTHADTPERCSAKSLKAVGSTLMNVLLEFAKLPPRPAYISREDQRKAMAERYGVLPLPDRGYEVTSEYSRIRVREKGTRRTLYFVRDNGHAVVETAMDLAWPEQLVVPYTRSMFASYFAVKDPKRVLIVGLGGGSMVRFLQHYEPDLEIDAIDIDPEVVKIAREYFGTKPSEKVKLSAADGYDVVRNPQGKYDVIYMDAFLKPSDETDSTGVPLRMKKQPFYEAMQSALNPGGAVVFNLNAHEKVNDDVLEIRRAFPSTYLFRVPGSDNYVVLATTESKRISDAELSRLGAQLDSRFETDFSFVRIARAVQGEDELPRREKALNKKAPQKPVARPQVAPPAR